MLRPPRHYRAFLREIESATRRIPSPPAFGRSPIADRLPIEGPCLSFLAWPLIPLEIHSLRARGAVLNANSPAPQPDGRGRGLPRAVTTIKPQSPGGWSGCQNTRPGVDRARNPPIEPVRR